MNNKGKYEENILNEVSNDKVEVDQTVEPIKTFKPAKTVRLSMAVIGIIIGLGVGFWAGSRNISITNNTSLDYSQLNEVYSVIRQYYDGEVITNDLLEGAKRGMVESLGDPYSQLFTYNETEDFYETMEGEFEGVGIELVNRDGKLTIVDVIGGTPAEEAGLAANDIIYKVDDYETVDWSSEAAVKVIRGEKGSQVKMTVLRDSETIEFDITRATINNPSVKWEIKNEIGILEISRFGENDTVKLTRQAANEFIENGVKGVVLDLRGNGGGYIDASVEVASLWMERGQIVTTEKKGGVSNSESKASSVNTLRGMNTVVLIDGSSASASEILAGALQDYGLAEIVGTNSFGKGSVQTLIPLSSGATIKLTIAKWYTPNGNNIDESGITPDRMIKFDSEAYQKDGSDNQIQEALSLLK